MLKNYFLEFKEIFIESLVFMKNNFKKYMLLIWLLIFLQLPFGVFCLYATKEYNSNLSIGLIIALLVSFLIFLFLLFMLYKNVFNMASFNLGKENLSNKKIIKSLLILGLFNLSPILVFVFCYGLAQFILKLILFLNISLNVFTGLFYLAMSLSIVSICKWNDINSIIAVVKSLKIFFKKFNFTAPLFIIMFALRALITYIICVILYAILLKIGILNENLVVSIQTMVNVYSLYIISGFYIGAQVSILKRIEE